MATSAASKCPPTAQCPSGTISSRHQWRQELDESASVFRSVPLFVWVTVPATLCAALEFLVAPALWSAWLQAILTVPVLVLGWGALSGAAPGVGEWSPRRTWPIVLTAATSFGYSFLTLLVASWGRLSYAHYAPNSRAPEVYFVVASTTVFAWIVSDSVLRWVAERFRRSLDRALAGAPVNAGVASSRSSPNDAVSTCAALLPETQGERESSPGVGLLAPVSRYAPVTAAAVGFGVALVSQGTRGFDASTAALVIAAASLATVCGSGIVGRFWRALGRLRLASLGARFRTDLIDDLADVDSMIFRKFRTITSGCPQVSDVVPLEPGISIDDMLYLASALIFKTDHPMREAILLRSSEICRTIPHIKDYQFVVGSGVRAVFQGQEVILGNMRYLRERGVNCDEIADKVDEFASWGKTVLLLSSNGRVKGLFALIDDYRDQAEDTIEELHSMNVETELFSEDHERTDAVLRKKLGLAAVRSELREEDIIAGLEELKQQGRCVGMTACEKFDEATLSKIDVAFSFGPFNDDGLHANEIRIAGVDLLRMPACIRIARAARRQCNLAAAAIVAYLVAATTVVALPFVGVPGFEHSFLASNDRTWWLAFIVFLTASLPAIAVALPSIFSLRATNPKQSSLDGGRWSETLGGPDEDTVDESSEAKRGGSR